MIIYKYPQMITNLPQEIVCEVAKWLYYENKFDISAIGRLAATCRYINMILDINGSRSPVTECDRARRMHSAKLRAEYSNEKHIIAQILKVGDELPRLTSYVLDNVTLPYDIILEHRKFLHDWYKITLNPLITIEILELFISMKLITRDTMFALNRESAVTLSDLESRKLTASIPDSVSVITMQQYKKYAHLFNHRHFLRQGNLTEADAAQFTSRADYAEILQNQNLSVKFLREHRDKHGLPKYSWYEQQRFCKDPEYGAEYMHEVMANMTLRPNQMITQHADLNFIVNNPQYYPEQYPLIMRDDITPKIIRENPQFNWDQKLFSPMYGYDPSEPKHAEIYDLYINDKLSMKDIVNNPNITWRHAVGLCLSISIDDVMSYGMEIQNKEFLNLIMYKISKRPDVTIDVILKHRNISQYCECLKILRPYIRKK